MAIVRCEKHPLGTTKRNYEGYALPIGFPETAAICGRVGCEEPGRVWLETDEVEAHRRGRRIFDVKTQTLKFAWPELITD